MKILELKEINKSYKDWMLGQRDVALKSISFSVNKGSSLGIIGKSGSGKSTIARIIAGFIKPDSGQVLINSKKLDGIGNDNIQMVFQDPKTSLSPKMTIEQILSEPLMLARYSDKTIRKRLHELLEELQLDKEILARYSSSLSGGQQQIIAIGRAIAISPEILILDEPLSSLDILAQNKIIKILKKLKDKHKFTIIFISHDLGITRDFCDEIAVLSSGVIIEHGSSAEVISNPKEEFTKELVAAVNVIGSRGGRS